MATVRELIAAMFAVTDIHVPVATPCHGWKTKIRVHDLRLTGEATVRCGDCGVHWHACADARPSAAQRRVVIWMSS